MLLLLLLILLTFDLREIETAPKVVGVDIKVTGSVPGVPGLYDCLLNLEGHEYDENKAQDCLSHILKSGYFNSGEKQIKGVDPGSVIVRFVLTAPALIVSEISLDTGDKEKAELDRWLALGRGSLRKGAIYRLESEMEAKTAIELYYKRVGRLVGVSSVVALNYSTGTATTQFKVTEGPTVPSLPVPPPYGAACPDMVGAIDWSDVDDYVPIPLVRAMVSLRASGSCFSLETLETDRKILNSSEFLQAAEISFEGPLGYKQISFRLRGKKLEVSKVTVQLHGALREREGQMERGLPASGIESVYTRKWVAQSLRYLTNSYQRPGLRLAIVEEDQFSPTRGLHVIFHVLAYEEDHLIIDSARIPPTTSLDPA